MTTKELEEWATDFETFHARFAPFFGRQEPREAARRYLRGLLAPLPRKNCWQMAEAVGDPDPQALQRLLYQGTWDAEAVQEELQRFVVEVFGHPEGIAVLDESAFVKKGEHSVGVKRQWCGTLGKKENCQVGVFLAYVSPQGYAFWSAASTCPRKGRTMGRAVKQLTSLKRSLSGPKGNWGRRCWRRRGSGACRCAGSLATRLMETCLICGNGLPPRACSTSWRSLAIPTPGRKCPA